MNEKMMFSFPWIPDVVQVTAYKFGICELCEKKKAVDDKWDNSKCPHCESEKRIHHAQFYKDLGTRIIIHEKD